MILGQIEVGSTLIPGGGGTVYLPLLVERARALEIIVSSEDYDADTAERYGWINRAIPDAELDDFVDRFARRIASFEKKALAEASCSWRSCSNFSSSVCPHYCNSKQCSL